MNAPGMPHRRSIRLPEYDYSQPGGYFVTVVTEGRRELFGAIVDDEMRLNPAGEMVQELWRSLADRFAIVEPGTFIVMPNHFHGILLIHEDVGATFMVAPERAGINPAPAHTRKVGNPKLGEIVGAFKSLTTRQYAAGVKTAAWAPFHKRLWQRNYYEHVIRDHDDWNRMHLYIESNPRAWTEDEENLDSVRQ
jgi:REP element-mobilizing transposase RayT